MCSVSWLVDQNGYQIFFNRDEQRSRALALPPTQMLVRGTRVLMPIDPVGQGSWISLNEFGMALCLLNNYQGQVPKGKLISRGQLLGSLSGEANVEQVKQAFQQLNLSQYAPFTLLAFDPKLNLTRPEVISFAWDGEKCVIHITDSPLFSSGVDLAAVQAYRHALYLEFTQNQKGFDQLLAFHSAHHHEFPHMSPCMHRDDAQTVSFTYIRVNKTADGGKRQSMAYVPGAPCHSQLSVKLLKQYSYRLQQAESLAS